MGLKNNSFVISILLGLVLCLTGCQTAYKAPSKLKVFQV